MKDDKQQVADEAIVEDKAASSKKEENDEVTELRGQVAEWEGKYKRALADYQNLQKRSRDERSLWIQSANKELLLRLLPVLDTLMLAASHLNDQGLVVSINQFLDILKAEGVTKIKTKGESFDPHTMECVMTEEGKENEVLEELRAGYLLNGNVLRAAQVKVGRA